MLLEGSLLLLSDIGLDSLRLKDWRSSLLIRLCTNLRTKATVNIVRDLRLGEKVVECLLLIIAHCLEGIQELIPGVHSLHAHTLDTTLKLG